MDGQIQQSYPNRWNLEIIDPIPCPDAFEVEGETALCSQAALILIIGMMLNPTRQEYVEELIALPPFELPILEPLQQNIPHSTFNKNVNDAEKFVRDLYDMQDEIHSTVKNIYSQKTEVKEELKLLSISLFHPEELIRISAAIAWTHIVKRPEQAFQILISSAMNSKDELIRSMAISTLARLQVNNFQWLIYKLKLMSSNFLSDLPKHIQDLINPKQTYPNVDSLLVHGTIFGRVNQSVEEWWKPRTGDFHNYLKNGPRKNLYDDDDFFYWTGAYNNNGRNMGGDELAFWIKRRGLTDIDIFAHSHGGNLVMKSTHNMSKPLDKLILLSCPVHWDEYYPDFNKVNEIISIRIKWDFVIMADLGGQRFKDSRIKEEVLPFWFVDHGSSRKSTTWKARKLDQLIGSK